MNGRKLLVLLGACAVLAAPLAGQRPPAKALDFDEATDAWARGDYPAALNGYLALLQRPDGDTYVERIALQTGELYRTQEITADGLSPRMSADGRMVAYETGSGAGRTTRLVEAAPSVREIAKLGGFGGAFSPAGDRFVYLRPRASDELTRAQAEAAKAGTQGGGRGAGQQLLTWLQTKHVDIVVRDLAKGQEQVVETEGLLKSAPVFAADGQSVLFVGAREADETRNDIYAAPVAGGQPQPISREGGFKTALVVEPKGQFLLYSVTSNNPFRRPTAAPGDPVAGGPPGAPGQAPGGGGGRGGAGQSTSFAVVDLKAGTAAVTTGTAPTISADGSTLAFLSRSGEETSLMVGPLGGAATAIRKTRDRVAAPALSPDGARVAFQQMPKDDWEIYLVNRDGSGEVRVTREIQHDLQPRFLTRDVLLGVIGEPRHQRSFLYDLRTLTRTRLFHNNTIRTIAPEYSWLPSADGSRLVIVAERDGDTVSAERGVYLVSLDSKVSRQDVIARVTSNLAAETDLRARGERMFAPIAADVRRTLAEISTSRIYTYEETLFGFDSKHISRPGNKLAGEYLFNLYTSFGYQPEYQWFEPRGALGGKSANVVATLKGTVNPELVYVVSSHYDSNTASPGADDDSSATAALLEAARVLAKRPMPATIVFASFTGEESGLLGSREFVRRARESGMKIVGGLNNDMIGWCNDERLDNTIRYSNPGIRDVQHAASFFTRLITYDALYYKSTDAAAFYEAFGDIVGGIGSYPVLGSPHYHQATDLLEYVNHDLVAETSKVTAASAMLLASSPARLTGLKVTNYAAKTATITWTASAEKGIASYVVAYGPAQNPLKNRLTVTGATATIPAVEPGTIVSVRAVNARGLAGWDWAKVEVR
jgi:Tol biopolymer transport system component